MTLGGPVRKDQTFFFASYQGNRQKPDLTLFRWRPAPGTAINPSILRETIDGALGLIRIIVETPRLLPSPNNFYGSNDGLNTGNYRFNSGMDFTRCRPATILNT
jgi:hypothetical protein